MMILLDHLFLSLLSASVLHCTSELPFWHSLQGCMLKDAELSLSDILQAKVHECSHVEAVS